MVARLRYGVHGLLGDALRLAHGGLGRWRRVGLKERRRGSRVEGGRRRRGSSNAIAAGGAADRAPRGFGRTGEEFAEELALLFRRVAVVWSGGGDRVPEQVAEELVFLNAVRRSARRGRDPGMGVVVLDVRDVVVIRGSVTAAALLGIL